MTRHCLTLDLQNNAEKIVQYEEYHKNVWPEILQSIKNSGIERLEIYRYNTRLFMIMEANENFSFEKKKLADKQNPKVQEWEQLMWKYQKALPGAAPGEKWMLMRKIFELE